MWAAGAELLCLCPKVGLAASKMDQQTLACQQISMFGPGSKSLFPCCVFPKNQKKFMEREKVPAWEGLSIGKEGGGVDRGNRAPQQEKLWSNSSPLCPVGRPSVPEGVASGFPSPSPHIWWAGPLLQLSCGLEAACLVTGLCG